jgi:hypothetical protein
MERSFLSAYFISKDSNKISITLVLDSLHKMFSGEFNLSRGLLGCDAV